MDTAHLCWDKLIKDVAVQTFASKIPLFVLYCCYCLVFFPRLRWELVGSVSQCRAGAGVAVCSCHVSQIRNIGQGSSHVANCMWQPGCLSPGDWLPGHLHMWSLHIAHNTRHMNSEGVVSPSNFITVTTVRTWQWCSVCRGGLGAWLEVYIRQIWSRLWKKNSHFRCMPDCRC